MQLHPIPRNMAGLLANFVPPSARFFLERILGLALLDNLILQQIDFLGRCVQLPCENLV